MYSLFQDNLPSVKAKEKGTILITTLLLLAVVTIIAIGMAERQQIDIKRTSQLLTAQQAYLYVKPAEIWAFQQLKALPINITPDTPQSQWPEVMPNIDIPGGMISAILVDAQGAFYNLNNLSNAQNLLGFSNFLNNLAPDAKSENEKLFIAAIISWLTPSGQQTDTLSDQYYVGLHPPYRAAHRLFVSPSELRLVKGMTTKSYSLLIPYLIALPEQTPVNINTASPTVLTSIGQGFSQSDAQVIADLRQQKGGFKKVGDFLTLPIMQNRNLSTQSYSIESNYFLLKTNILLNHQSLTVYTLFKRTKNESKKTNNIKILWQTRETL